MSLAKLKSTCPNCQHVYEFMSQWSPCPECDFKPRMVVDVSSFQPTESAFKYILGLLALAAALAAVFGFGII